MRFEEAGLAYSKIGGLLLNRVEDQHASIMLYAEAEPGVMGGGAYQDRGQDILYVELDTELFDALFAAWNSEEPGKRWSSMELLINDRKFSASFSYKNFVDYDSDRENDALRRHFGDKPVFYPGPTFEERYEALDPKNFSSFT